MARALKVYRTAIGFHDAYVAAPTMKAALEAWGTTTNLFARGVAEAVDDPKLTAAPLARPGEVIKVSRGSIADNLAALPRDEPQAKAPAKAPARKAAPLKRPDRSALDAADQALAAARDARDAEDARWVERIAALEADRRKAAAAADRDIAKLESARDKAAESYDAKLARWRES